MKTINPLLQKTIQNETVNSLSPKSIVSGGD